MNTKRYIINLINSNNFKIKSEFKFFKIISAEFFPRFYTIDKSQFEFYKDFIFSSKDDPFFTFPSLVGALKKFEIYVIESNIYSDLTETSKYIPFSLIMDFDQDFTSNIEIYDFNGLKQMNFNIQTNDTILSAVYYESDKNGGTLTGNIPLYPVVAESFGSTKSYNFNIIPKKQTCLVNFVIVKDANTLTSKISGLISAN